METEAILERRRLRRRASFWRVTAIVILVVAILVGFSRFSDRIRGIEGLDGGGEVADIKIDGFIGTRPGAIDQIRLASEASPVKAIMLHINSGGGAASGGEALYRAIRKAGEKKPVVAVIDGTGASAAYMTALGADYIVARRTAVTGSIGVIFQYAHFEQLLQKLGADYAEIKSSPLKGEPTLFNPPAPGAEAMMRSVVDDTYDWFVGLVAERRKLPRATALRLSDGRVYTGGQALKDGLIDAVGGDDEARDWLQREKGVSKVLPLREWKKDQTLTSLFFANGATALARLVGLEPAASALIPQRLAVDGLLSVWQGQALGQSDRQGANGDKVGAH